MDVICGESNNKEENNVTIDKDMPRISLSPITTQCDPDKALRL